MLDLDHVDAYYGDSHILHGVSFTVRDGEVVCLLGRNGAGKTTTIMTVMGYLHPRHGAVRYNGRDIGVLSLLPVQQTYQQALITLIQARAARYADTVALYQALGGGWWNRVDVQEKPEPVDVPQ